MRSTEKNKRERKKKKAGEKQGEKKGKMKCRDAERKQGGKKER
jgi:hypothetical protein